MGHEGIQRVKTTTSNSYILPCDGGYLVIDTGHKRYYEKYIRGLSRLGLDLKDLRYVLLTHHHDDHAGLVAQIMDHCDAKIIVHEKGVRPLKEGENELGEALNNRIKPFIALMKLLGAISSFPPVVLRDEDLLIAGDDDVLLRGIGIEGRILHTPGHSKDSISVVLDDGNAFVGDLAMNMLKVAGTRYRPPYIDSMDELLESWRKVLDVGSRNILPTHGMAFPAERLIATGWL